MNTRIPDHSNAPANPADGGKPVNYKPGRTFYQISDAERAQAIQDRQDLINRSRETLRPFSEEN